MHSSFALPFLTLAPLRGVTVAVFRRRLARHFGGFDAALAPFIPTVAGERIRPGMLRDVERAADEAPMALVPQIIGKDPAQIAPMASALRARGLDRLNLNAGCPWKFVAKKGRGSGLLRDADALRRMLEAGCAAVPGGFSVKVRLGVETPDLLAERMSVLAEFPLRCVVIHPRTAAQMYEGDVLLDEFEAVSALCPHPVVYNGDIRTAGNFLALRRRFPRVAGWMVGRGAVADPALGRAIQAAASGAPPPPPATPAELRAFHDGLYADYRAELFGPTPVLGRMKEFWGYFHARFPDGAAHLRRIQRSATLADFERHAAAAFGDIERVGASFTH